MGNSLMPQANYIEIAQQYIADLYPLIVYAQPRIMDLPPGAIIGTWAYSIPNKQRYVIDRSREIAPGVMPGDLARAWIRDQYKLPIRRRKEQMDRNFAVPIHARPGKHGNCFYVDIKKAYAAVLTLGYDVDYLLGKYLGATPRQIPHEILDSKGCYSLAVTMSGSKLTNIEMVGKQGLFHVHSFNTYSNPSLFNLAQDTLNGIGSEVLHTLGDSCVYMNTDGFIVKEGSEDKVNEIVESWGFKSAIKHYGATSIFGVGSYKIGDYRTKRLDDSSDFTGKLMEAADRRWLKMRWDRWSSNMSRLAGLS